MEISIRTLFEKLSPGSAARITVLRLFMAWVPLMVLIGVAVWAYETERLESKVLNDAISDAYKVEPSDLQRYYDKQANILDLHAAAKKALGELVSIEIYNADGQEIVQELNERASLITEDIWVRAEATHLTTKPFYDQINKDGRMTIITVVPLKNDGALIIGYLKGIYLVPKAMLDEMREDSLGASLVAFCSVLVTMLVVVPIILFMQQEHAAQTARVLEGNTALLEVLGNAVAHRDSDTDSHNYRVTIYALRLAERLGLDTQRMRILIVGSFLHDVGKIGISDTILLKCGKLTEEEFEVMKTHVRIGTEIVRQSPWLTEAISVVECHHEKYNGTGYPRGLSGDQIPLEARIFAVADVFDALTTARPYKKPYPFDEAIGMMRNESNIHFDPTVINCFAELAQGLYEEIAGASHDELRNIMRSSLQRYLTVL
jgi:HD-GYP domain-containing protein (c-di-GMP phosphodiesterase class II)